MSQYVVLMRFEGEVEIVGVKPTFEEAAKLTEDGYNAWAAENDSDRETLEWETANTKVKVAWIGQGDAWYEIHEVQS